MRLAGRAKLRVDAEMHLQLAVLEPRAAPPGEGRRLRDLGNLQQAGVELAGAVLAALRHGELDVVEAHDRHRPRS